VRRGLTQLRRAVAIAAVLLSVSAVAMRPVYAGVTGNATRTQTATSGTWKAAPSTTSFTFSSGGLSPVQYFSLTNTGTLALVGATYSTSITSGTGTVSVKACSVAWNETLNVCVGITTTVVTTANSPQSVSGLGQFPASTGSAIRLQISDTGVGAVTASFAASVARSQVRTATTTNG
jgi:hypothetical protein